MTWDLGAESATGWLADSECSSTRGDTAPPTQCKREASTVANGTGLSVQENESVGARSQALEGLGRGINYNDHKIGWLSLNAIKEG